MYKSFSRDVLSPFRVLILNTSPGKALQAMIGSWQKIPNIRITVNNFQLPHADCNYLAERHPNITQVEFDPLNESAFIEHVKKAQGYSIITTRLNVPFKKVLLETLTSLEHEQPLKILGQAGSTVSHVDLVTATKKSVAVTYTPGANANAVAEFVLAQIFTLTRPLTEYNQLSHDRIWSKYLLPPQEELSGKILGLIGFGHIAQALSTKAKALGMCVIVYTRTQPKIDDLLKIEFIPDLETLLRKANIISLHVPLTPSTKQLIGTKEIDLMKKGSYLINTSRGGIVDEKALAKELQKTDSRIAGIAFDVFENEGATFQSPLIKCKNALLTPHIAGTTNRALTSTSVQLVHNINAILLNSSPFLANPDCLAQISFFSPHN